MNWIVFAQEGGKSGGMFDPTLMLVIFGTFAIFYFVLIRPQQKKQKELQKTIGALTKGDRVMTNGGMFGTVVGMKDNIIVLKIAENTKIEILKTAIANVVGSGDQAEQK
jgi:preprotein translocase subunit YajC